MFYEGKHRVRYSHYAIIIRKFSTQSGFARERWIFATGRASFCANFDDALAKFFINEYGFRCYTYVLALSNLYTYALKLIEINACCFFTCVIVTGVVN